MIAIEFANLSLKLAQKRLQMFYMIMNTLSTIAF